MHTPQGFVNLDKPVGMASRRATDLVARAFRTDAAGHAGTLDPAASGVLPVALGGATRLVELLHDADKEYRARVLLGYATDTDDTEGRPLGSERAVTATREDVERALAAFRGTVLQRPPAYSALKRDGQAAYQSARAGEAVDLEPRPVTFHELTLMSFESPVAEISARVSRGTYLRALARDLGTALGCGGHLAGLVRTRVGALRIENAVTIAQIKELSAAGRAAEAVLPIRRALPDLPVLIAADDKGRRAVLQGKALPVSAFAADGRLPAAGEKCLLFDSAGVALTLAEALAGPDGALVAQPRKRLT